MGERLYCILIRQVPSLYYRKQGDIAFFGDNSMLFYQPSFVNYNSDYNSGAFNGRVYEDYFEAKRKLADHLKEIKKQLVQLKVQEIDKDFENE